MVHLVVKSGNYPDLLRTIQLAGMITYYPLSYYVVENSIFGVWNGPGSPWILPHSKYSLFHYVYADLESVRDVGSRNCKPSVLRERK